VRFEIETDFPELTRCDCSICRRKNALMVKVHESKFKLLAGEDSLTEYQFHTRTAPLPCKVSGIYPFQRSRRLFRDQRACDFVRQAYLRQTVAPQWLSHDRHRPSLTPGRWPEWRRYSGEGLLDRRGCWCVHYRERAAGSDRRQARARTCA
jgi:hypothetical protein